VLCEDEEMKKKEGRERRGKRGRKERV